MPKPHARATVFMPTRGVWEYNRREGRMKKGKGKTAGEDVVKSLQEKSGWNVRSVFFAAHKAALKPGEKLDRELVEARIAQYDNSIAAGQNPAVPDVVKHFDLRRRIETPVVALPRRRKTDTMPVRPVPNHRTAVCMMGR